MTSQQNTMWICQVKKLLKEGFGTEDIAIKLKCKINDVRNEVKILREMGELDRIYGTSNEGRAEQLRRKIEEGLN